MNKKESALAGEITGICVVCNKRIKEENKAARQVDGLSVCGSVCISKFLKEKKKWTAENWDAICKMQVLYEERKREEKSQLINQ